ncbi:MAG: hypothetical protein HQK63_15085 [Desulfamplus sp.]|nr:hypothetical protein [Desulfamplus sp.]
MAKRIDINISLKPTAIRDNGSRFPLKCAICRNGHTDNGFISVVFEQKLLEFAA